MGSTRRRGPDRAGVKIGHPSLVPNPRFMGVTGDDHVKPGRLRVDVESVNVVDDIECLLPNSIA